MQRYNQVEGYDIECVKNEEPIIIIHPQNKCKTIILYIIGIILLIVITLLFIINTDIIDTKIRNTTKIMNTTNYIQLQAYVGGAGKGCLGCHHHHEKLCSEYEYGCCNISTYGTIYNNTLYFVELNIDIKNKIRRDKIGSNCPRYRLLIEKYDNYYLNYNNYPYGKKYCNSTIENCCKINYIYDILYKKNLENYSDTYIKNSIIKYNYSNYSNYRIFELNIKGTCPTGEDIINRYNKGYENPNMILIIYGFLISIALCFCACCMDNKKYR